MAQSNDIHPKYFGATELDYYKYIIDSGMIDDPAIDAKKDTEATLNHVFEWGSQSVSSLHAAIIYAKSLLPPLNEQIRVLRVRVLEYPEMYGDLTNKELQQEGAKNLYDGPMDEKKFRKALNRTT